MLKAVKILFLGLSILFSFGFTAVESHCDKSEEITCESHSCCEDKHEKPHADEDCGGACCLQPISVLSLNDFVNSGKKIEQETKIFDADYSLYTLAQTQLPVFGFTTDFTHFMPDFIEKERQRHQALNQVWLI